MGPVNCCKNHHKKGYKKVAFNIVEYNVKVEIIVIVPLLFSLSLYPISIDLFKSASAQQNNDLNVTNDMIYLLTSLVDFSGEQGAGEIINETSKVQENLQELRSFDLSYTSPHTIMLDGITIPENNIIPIYDTEPMFISEGHLIATLPCDENQVSPVNILVGKIPNLSSIFMELVPQFSDAGENCFFQRTLASTITNPISQIALQNNSTEEIEFPSTSVVILGVSKLANNNTG